MPIPELVDWENNLPALTCDATGYKLDGYRGVHNAIGGPQNGHRSFHNWLRAYTCFGTTVEEIASEKCGIIKPNTPVILSRLDRLGRLVL